MWCCALEVMMVSIHGTGPEGFVMLNADLTVSTAQLAFLMPPLPATTTNGAVKT